MLESKYNCILLGKNYLSVLFGILKIKSALPHISNSALLIDNKNNEMGENWSQNIGEIEKRVFEKIGEQFSISPLKKMDKYISPINTIIIINETLVEFGSSPYANIRELSRKLPEAIPPKLLATLEKYGEENFNQDCFSFIEEVALKLIDNDKINNRDSLFTNQSSLKILFDNFINYLESKTQMSEQFHYVLQVLFQTFFSNLKDPEGLRYLLISILSPRYKIDNTSLLNDLIFEFKSIGGEITESDIDGCEIYKNNLEFIKLKSLDGILGLDKLYIFSKLSQTIDFEHKQQYQAFDTIKLEAQVEHEILRFYKEKRIIFSKTERLGTDFPHFEIYIDNEGKLSASYSFANYLGTKPSFFYKKVENEVYEALNDLLPQLSRDGFVSSLKLSPGSDYMEQVSPDMRRVFVKQRSRSELFESESSKIVNNLEYFGPFRTQSKGLYSYLWDLVGL